MVYSKFYTPPEIASALINELAISKPPKIVDICCGSCNLLFAAKKKWTEAILYGVDITDQSFSEKVVFEKKDGRQFSIEHSHEFSLVVANPPFDYVDTKKQFPELFVNEFEELYTSRLEIEMLIANIRLLQQDGVLLIILPSSFVEAETYEKIRKIIANNYYIAHDTFHNNFEHISKRLYNLQNNISFFRIHRYIFLFSSFSMHLIRLHPIFSQTVKHL